MARNVMVTGATSGFGAAIAGKFAANGDNIIATGRRADRLQELKDKLESEYDVKVITLHFDVRDRNEVTAAVEQLSGMVDCVDILVNNAGLAAGLSTIDDGDVDDWDIMVDTNLKGLLYVTKYVLPLIKKSKQGHIINIGSTAGKVAYKNGNVYCATKFAVDALSQTMRIDLLPFGIKVTSVNPGLAETEFSIVRFKGDEDKAKSVYKGLDPLVADDIADVAFYCASQPAHVCINDITVTCTNQANSFYIIRDSEKVKNV
ncbi:MAG: SDR family NAD(P)-dependent oxidoreductase [Chitinophagales bacterium]|nr:SDR family NAD(P)-dependent oxidoreductase [Chitinophagaceae bacterium]MCB9064205.1 SDR family NAD(P)-dependent oxidoreductase [Chitinophagales bacterium]